MFSDLPTLERQTMTETEIETVTVIDVDRNKQKQTDRRRAKKQEKCVEKKDIGRLSVIRKLIIKRKNTKKVMGN